VLHKNLTPFAWGPRVTSRRPPQVEMAICVRGVYHLAPGRELECIEDPLEQGFMSGDTFADDDLNQLGEVLHANDFADFKLNAEVLLKGSCHPPGGPATECTPRFTVGAWSKALHVVGPRVYERRLLAGGKISPPQPFRSMPLTWQNAYGGERFAENPHGRGHEGEQLPTVEPVEQPVKKVGDKAARPASFLPVSPHWPQRAGKRGRDYGDSWKKTRAPFYSADFDWTYFHAAPDDQQLDGYLRGDETLTFEHLHPDASHWQTQLPGLRLRAFVKTTDGRIHEPDMLLDTLFADLDGEQLHLTWRGLAPIGETDMTDVSCVLIASEPLDSEPLEPAHYIALLEQHEQDPVGLQAAMPPGFMMFAEAVEAAEQAELHGTPMPDLDAVAAQLPPDCPFPPWFLAAVGGDEDPLGIKEQFPPGMLEGDPAMGQDAMVGGLAAKKDELIADVAALKDDPSAAPKVMRAVAGLLPPDKQEPFLQGLDSLEQAIEAGNEGAGQSIFSVAADQGAYAPEPQNMSSGYADLLKSANDGIAEGGKLTTNADNLAKVSEAQAKLGSAPKSLDEAVSNAMAPLNDMQVPDMPEIPDVEADLAAQSAKLDQDEARMRDKFGDHPLLGMFDLGRNLIENAPRPGELAPDLSAIPANLKIAQANLEAQGISAAAMAPLTALIAKIDAVVEKVPKPPPLPEGAFVGQDLRGRDFRGQDVRGEKFCKADLTGANFAGCDLTEADFTKANLTAADLTGATLSDATCKGATLDKALLRDAVAPRANLSNCQLVGLDATGADLRGAKLTKAIATKAIFANATLADADARFADLSKCDLRATDATGANLSFATCNLVKADGVVLAGATLDIAKLTRSRLQGADLKGARCTMGDFTQSDLTGADLRGCSFERADLMKSVLDRTDLRDSKLVDVSMRDTIANGADFRGADLTASSATGQPRFIGCDFRHATGDRSIWMDAELTGSNFRHARFVQAYFQGARGDDVDFTAAVLKHANFRKSQLRRPSFRYADLASSIFQESSVDDGNFERSNCYDAKFLGAKAVRCSFAHAFLVAVQLDEPEQGTGGTR